MKLIAHATKSQRHKDAHRRFRFRKSEENQHFNLIEP